MKRICFLVLVSVFSITAAASAATYTIKFGGSLGKTYSPKSLAVSVGDTIVWVGNFDDHPLTLTKSPAGAKAFMHIENGASYRYIVRVAGSYAYQCDEHEGMVGSFTASGGAPQTPATK
ncbi:MAG TPA: plastocyanin/azurin family copper-binding protein [Candidatus Kapabacteria bacterium]|jgi:plastocyanin|nr:plastocyanin/azurin family copper-binding protein [Candidatus Kapabacteria bacterium]